MTFDRLKEIAAQEGVQYAWLRQNLNDFEMAKLLFSSNKDAPVNIITKKQAVSAIDTLNNTLIILEQLYDQN